MFNEDPILGAKLWDDGVDSCVVVIYGLKEKFGSGAGALLAYRPKVIAFSNGVSREARKAIEYSLSKWRFLAKTQNASKDQIYYSVIIL